MKFKIGNIVRLTTGYAPQEVTSVNFGTGQIRTLYVSALGNPDCYEQNRWRSVEDYVFFETPTPTINQGEQPMNTLYQTKEEKPRFGTFLAKNSKGQIVLEMKGESGAAQAFDVDDIEEVQPYTVNLQPVDKAKPSIHVVGQEGQVELDDVLIELNTGLMWRVTKLDTKIRSPMENKSKWLKIQAAKITFG